MYIRKKYALSRSAYLGFNKKYYIKLEKLTELKENKFKIISLIFLFF